MLQEVDEALVDKFAMLVNEGVSVSYVREFLVLLSSLCTCHGQPMPELQALLRVKLLQGSDNLPVFDTFVDPQTRHVKVFAPVDADGSCLRQGLPYLQWPRVAVPLHEFLDASPANDQYFSTVIHFMATVSPHLLLSELFVLLHILRHTAMCGSRNRFSRAVSKSSLRSSARSADFVA